MENKNYIKIKVEHIGIILLVILVIMMMNSSLKHRKLVEECDRGNDDACRSLEYFYDNEERDNL